MSRFQLSRAATEDLLEIRAYTRERFGAVQAVRIRERLLDVFRLLSGMPFLAPERHDLDPPGKRFRYQPVAEAFVIVYEPAQDGIRVARVLHGARNLARELEREQGDV